MIQEIVDNEAIQLLAIFFTFLGGFVSIYQIFAKLKEKSLFDGDESSRSDRSQWWPRRTSIGSSLVYLASLALPCAYWALLFSAIGYGALLDFVPEGFRFDLWLASSRSAVCPSILSDGKESLPCDFSRRANNTQSSRRRLGSSISHYRMCICCDTQLGRC